MAINKNHEFEDLDGVKCAIVEKNVTPERLAFIKPLLELNRYTVVAVNSPAPKVVATPAPIETTDTTPPPTPELPTTFTVGVTNVVFNITNALMGRLLKTKEGKVITTDFWYQRKKDSREDIPYFEKSDKW